MYTTVDPEIIYNYSNKLINILEEDDDPIIMAFKSRTLSF